MSVSPPDPRPALQAATALALGGLAGATALLVDLLLARLLTGFGDSLLPEHAAIYLAVGGLGGLLAWLVWRGAEERGRKSSGIVGGLLAVYTLALVGKLWDMGRGVLPLQLAAVAGGLVVVGVAGFVLGRWLRHPMAAGMLLAAGLAAVLSVNRHLAGHWFEALGVNLLLLAGWGAIAWLHRGRRWRLLSSLAVLAVLAATVALWPTRPPTAAPDAGERPNLLLVVVDTLRLDVFRSVLAETPEGERLRHALHGSAHFDKAIAASSWTAPSMASMLTGLHPQRHGLVKTGTTRQDGWSYRTLSPGTLTLAEHLSAAGYYCEALVANAMLNRGTGLHRGFAHYEQLRGPTRRLPLLVAASRLGWLPPRPYQPADDVRRRFLARLPELRSRGPFFAWLHFMDPHHPLSEHPELTPDAGETGLEDLERRYRRETRFTAFEVATVLEALRNEGLDDTTWVVLVSDHGEMLPDDRPAAEDVGYGHGHALFEPLVHVPLIIRPPGGWGEDRRIEEVVGHVDLFPTVLELLRTRPTEPLTGPDAPRSLTPWLASRPFEASPDEETYALTGTHHIRSPQRALRGRSWKLIEWLEEERSVLYDLRTDAEERRDLSAEQPELAEELKQRLDRQWRRLEAAQTGDEVSIDEETRRQLEALGYVD